MNDNFILKNENAIYYECAYSCDNCVFLAFKDDKFFLTDARYIIEAKENIKNATVIETSALIKDAKKLIKKFKAKKIIFDPFDFCVAEFKKLCEISSTKFVSKPHFSKFKRIVKNENEIIKLKKAANLGAKCFDEFANFINTNENLDEFVLNFNVRRIFRQNGALDLSFNPISAINENAAKAHATPSKKTLTKGDLLLLDAGVKFERFCSDRTRTAFYNGNLNFSKEQNFSTQKQNEVFDIVKTAQSEAIKAIKPGILAKDIDKIARNFIKKAGFGEFFTHSTGHGVGLDIHEFPSISPKSKDILEKGMVFSVEPGIYIQNEFGIRIEDVVVVTENGCEIL